MNMSEFGKLDKETASMIAVHCQKAKVLGYAMMDYIDWAEALCEEYGKHDHARELQEMRLKIMDYCGELRTYAGVYKAEWEKREND